ncbi:MAG: formate--phosphoribosylaminoimidazolecarboxamide ligase [Sulfolobales archaeon]|nr:formate--phosphoribosylaminoimidazolecarboxamide ligase [Sulfolobales archaeon]
MRFDNKEFKVDSVSDISIATLCTHTSLQIFHGAKNEGFKTVGIVESKRKWFYESFSNLIDEFIVLNNWRELCRYEVISKLRELNSLLIPHGSFVEYVGLDCVMGLPIPMFGLRELLVVESNQHRKMDLLSKAGITIPKSYKIGERIEGTVIVKLPGAKGGKGYFIANNTSQILSNVNELMRKGYIKDVDDVLIQEYVVGVPAYFHFFHSPVLNRTELLGMDIRYESNVDGLRRLPPSASIDVNPTFNVVGNLPLVLRESMLLTVMKYGINFVNITKSEVPPGIVGPFCLESIINDAGDVVVFEFSGRIVAGTNIYIHGSPYSWLYWNEPMSMGRRIAREIKMAVDLGKLNYVIT